MKEKKETIMPTPMPTTLVQTTAIAASIGASPTSRAHCRTCHGRIYEGRLRAESDGSRYHVPCFIDELRAAVAQATVAIHRDIGMPGEARLREEMEEDRMRDRLETAAETAGDMEWSV